MAADAGGLHAPSALCALTGALLIQIGTNYANDYSDYAKGTDTPERLGPTRATQAGFVTPRAMWLAAAITFALACVPGLYIVLRGGWPFVIIGLLSIACGVLYTAGPYPLGYIGLADLFVLIFFGPVAVGGTYYVQALDISAPVIVAGFGPGLFSVAILTVNNLRDIDQDRAAGKKTLPVRFGRGFARFEYIASIVLATWIIPDALAVYTQDHLFVMFTVVALGAAAPTMRKVCTETDGAVLNDMLANTGKLLMLFSLLFSAGWML